MTFSPQLEERFAKMLDALSGGPASARAVVPMLIYAQDETGAITPELIEEVAKRCDVEPLQVDEVVGYYSMLHRKPHGQISRPGLHQHQLHAGGRRGIVRTREEKTRNRAQGSNRPTASFR